MTQSISAKEGKMEAIFLTQKGGPTTTTSLSATSTGNSLLSSLEAATVMGQAKRFQTQQPPERK